VIDKSPKNQLRRYTKLRAIGAPSRAGHCDAQRSGTHPRLPRRLSAQHLYSPGMERGGFGAAKISSGAVA
jgi:hypothetical protein